MRLPVLGGQGAFPTAAAGCSGYVISGPTGHLLVDPGWGTFRDLLGVLAPHEVDAVIVTHGHPDHCADLLPLLRARTMDDDRPSRPLPVFAPAGAVEPLLLGEPVRSAVDAIVLDVVADGATHSVAGFDLVFADLPHHVPNLGVRITEGSVAISYTGDAGPSPATVDLAGTWTCTSPRRRTSRPTSTATRGSSATWPRPSRRASRPAPGRSC